MQFLKLNFKIKVLIIFCLAIFAFCVFFVQKVNAATVYANSSTGNDANACAVDSPCKTFTRAYAVASDSDTINLTGTFDWSNADETGDTTSSYAGYNIAKSLTIQGQGADQTIIQANSSLTTTTGKRIFTIAGSYNVTIKNVTLRYGAHTQSDMYGGSGVYFNGSGSLTILDSVITQNAVPTRFGGAPIVVGQSASGKFVIRNSTVHENNGLTSGGYVGYTGGLAILGSNASHEVTNCTFYNNRGGYEGGIYITGSGKNITVTNSTFVGNNGSSSAADIYSYGSAVVYVKNNIFADSAGGSNLAVGSGGSFVDGGYNIVETQSSAGFTNGVNGNIVGNQANLNIDTGLALNGSTTGVPTLTLLADSVAINAGDSSAHNGVDVPSTDQRGFARSGAVDIGACEYQGTYILTYSAGANGSITGTSSQTVNIGEDGSAVTAVPNANYHFVNWSDSSTDNPRQDLTVSGYISVTANFAIDTYTLTYTAGANGSITGSSPQTVDSGSDGSAVEAVPDSGYLFSSWSDASEENPRTDTNVAANVSVTASFVVADSEAPVLSNVAAYTSSTGAIITWDTDEDASALVNYGLTSSCSSSTSESDISPRDTGHSITISNLVSCTRYYYKAQSTDGYSNTGYSSVGTFKTTGCTGDATVTATGQSTATSGSGGTLTQGNLALTIPASFKTGTDSAVFQANQLSNADFIAEAGTPSGLNQIGSDVYTLRALSDEGTAVSTFDSAITVAMTYSDDDISTTDESTLWIYRYDGSNWNALTGCNVDTSANTVTCDTTSFSDFAIFGEEGTCATVAHAATYNAYPTCGPATCDTGYSLSGGSCNSVGGGGIPVHILQQMSDQMRIDALNKQIEDLKTQIAVISKVDVLKNSDVDTDDDTNYQFTRDLYLGRVGEDVKQLQIYLNNNGFKLADSGDGSNGSETDFFGQLTKQALIKFQKANKIEPAYGFFGPVTRALINK